MIDNIQYKPEIVKTIVGLSLILSKSSGLLGGRRLLDDGQSPIIFILATQAAGETLVALLKAPTPSIPTSKRIWIPKGGWDR